MKRRDLLKGIATIPLLSLNLFSQKSMKTNLIKPKRLKEGDTIGLIAPASNVDDQDFQNAVKAIESFGFKPKIGKNARKFNGYLAGTDKERLADLHWAFSDKEIKAVWCIRGGYGVTRLLPNIDFSLIKKNPKVVIGYSDITALLVSIYQNAGLVTFHGPVASSSFSEYSKTHCLDVLMNPTSPYKIELSEENKAEASELYKTEIITRGKARGKLVGGNLSLIAAMCGTKFGLKNTKGKLLFLEDVNEAPYRVDRMLTQLRQSVDLTQLAGIACGIFEDSSFRKKENTDNSAPKMIDTLKDRLGDLKIPVIYGLSFGHINRQFTLPIGIEAELDTENATMTFLENGVS
jgi:muramoyltetrapeptide carboxypeptidase